MSPSASWFQSAMVLFTKEYFPTSVRFLLALIFHLWSPLFKYLYPCLFPHPSASTHFVQRTYTCFLPTSRQTFPVTASRMMRKFSCCILYTICCISNKEPKFWAGWVIDCNKRPPQTAYQISYFNDIILIWNVKHTDIPYWLNVIHKLYFIYLSVSFYCDILYGTFH
jgi:hypothetical protein